MGAGGVVQRAERATTPSDGLEAPALALVGLRVETRSSPRWTEQWPHALTRISDRLVLSPLPPDRIGNVEPNLTALGAGGQSLVAQPTWPRATGGAPLGRSTERALLWVDLQTLRARRLAWTPRPGGATSLEYSASPDGRQVAVAESVREAGVRGPCPIHLLLVPVDGGEPRALLVLPPSVLLHGSGDSFVQWSADGSRLALSYREADDIGPTTIVVDVSTGEVVSKAGSTRLMGSQSFSDDGTRLLVGSRALYPHVLDVATSEKAEVEWLPDSQPDPGPRPTACGFVGSDHLLITRQRAGTVTVSALALETGVETRLVRWVAGRDNAPNVGTFSRTWHPELQRALST